MIIGKSVKHVQVKWKKFGPSELLSEVSGPQQGFVQETEGASEGIRFAFSVFTKPPVTIGVLFYVEKSSAKDTKKFYERYHSTVFFTFYACFTTIEAALQSSRGTKSSKTRQEAYLKDLTDVILPALEVIL